MASLRKCLLSLGLFPTWVSLCHLLGSRSLLPGWSCQQNELCSCWWWLHSILVYIPIAPHAFVLRHRWLRTACAHSKPLYEALELHGCPPAAATLPSHLPNQVFPSACLGCPGPLGLSLLAQPKGLSTLVQPNQSQRRCLGWLVS